MLRRTVVLAFAVVLVSVDVGAAQEPSMPGPRTPEIVTGGEGMRSVQADRASVIISVETRARTPSQAGALNATRNNAIRAAIAAVGVPREDIVTSGYMVYAMRQEPPFTRDTGYVASNAVRVILRRPDQLSLLGRIIDTALTAGATHIAGVRHEARRTDEAEREALGEALTDARARAEVIARAAGGSLAELLQVEQSGPMVTTSMDFAARARSAAMARAYSDPTSVTSGEIEVRQYVTARWRFVPGGR
jgi:uncharacterized protein YggE